MLSASKTLLIVPNSHLAWMCRARYQSPRRTRPIARADTALIARKGRRACRPRSSVATASMASSSGEHGQVAPRQPKVNVVGEVLRRLDDLAGIQPMSRIRSWIEVATQTPWACSFCLLDLVAARRPARSRDQRGTCVRSVVLANRPGRRRPTRMTARIPRRPFPASSETGR